LAELDAARFTFHGWEGHKTQAEVFFVEQEVDVFHLWLAQMKRKQMCQCDRLADPLLVELDAIVAGSLMFVGWPRIKAECEKQFVSFGGGVGSDARKTLEGVKSRQLVVEQREAVAKSKKTSACLQSAAMWVLVGDADSRHKAASKTFVGRCQELGLVQSASKRPRQVDVIDLTDDDDTDATAVAAAVPASKRARHGNLIDLTDSGDTDAAAAAAAVPASPSIDSQSPRCTICHQNPITHLLIPCGHMCVCGPCAAISVRHHKCPLQGCGNGCVESTVAVVQTTDVGSTIIV
jgi:hypothetical protein